MVRTTSDNGFPDHRLLLTVVRRVYVWDPNVSGVLYAPVSAADEAVADLR